MEKILIGTSGYDYPEWVGIFYPPGLPRKEFLEYYSTRFNALEINNTFYNMPDQMRMRNFYERTEGRVMFSIKANRTLTHEINSGNSSGNSTGSTIANSIANSIEWKKRAEEFKFSLLPMQQKGVLSSVLFQFPQNFHYTPQNRYYLAALIKEFEGFPVVVEFRHKEWIKESVFEGLASRGASIVFCDMPQLKALPDGNACKTPFIGPNAYIRLHGRNSSAWYAKPDSFKKNPEDFDMPDKNRRYDYEYSDEEIDSFVPVIQSAYSEGKVVSAYFNNHPRGSGAKNALRLIEIIKKVIILS